MHYMGDPVVDRADQLQSVKMRIVNSGVCAFINPPGPQVEPNMVCALGTTSRTGVCQGDSGSALMVAARYKRSRRVVFGITSWGYGCAPPLSPSVYARVPWFLDWIIGNTRDAEYC
ncbi:Transmembrane protease serine 11G [Amphibalanus amphitrite]|uniref:Transmembrane protease serine 11G n=1 Tax=Amphibalanus amphitrite TaxID=1232801 RepID=A0A6A4WAP3_AMPAM|nr:Transmembrane protease serine 11G [Amphibalanus amphitrite]